MNLRLDVCLNQDGPHLMNILTVNFLRLVYFGFILTIIPESTNASFYSNVPLYFLICLSITMLELYHIMVALRTGPHGVDELLLFIYYSLSICASLDLR